jgi:hypothetical protein
MTRIYVHSLEALFSDRRLFRKNGKHEQEENAGQATEESSMTEVPAGANSRPGCDASTTAITVGGAT